MAFWNSVKDSSDPNELQAYLNKYPRGQFAELAVIRKQHLEKSKSAYVSTANNLKNRSTQTAVAEVRSGSTDIDPRFDQYLTELKSALSEQRRPNIASVLPVLLPVNERNSRKVEAVATQIFRGSFPSAAAISISPTGAVVVGTSPVVVSIYANADATALSDCESKRKGAEAVLPKCEVFVRSRTIDAKALINMVEKVRGPDFDIWIKGLNESVAAWRK
ncbi:MAG TPA: hypothetical protein VIF82_11975 [Burkholderiaceae bacterium]|jgi:hypothetical protein